MTPKLISTPAGNQKKNTIIMSEIRSSSIWYSYKRVFLLQFFTTQKYLILATTLIMKIPKQKAELYKKFFQTLLGR